MLAKWIHKVFLSFFVKAPSSNEYKDLKPLSMLIWPQISIIQLWLTFILPSLFWLGIDLGSAIEIPVLGIFCTEMTSTLQLPYLNDWQNKHFHLLPLTVDTIEVQSGFCLIDASGVVVLGGRSVPYLRGFFRHLLSTANILINIVCTYIS